MKTCEPNRNCLLLAELKRNEPEHRFVGRCKLKTNMMSVIF